MGVRTPDYSAVKDIVRQWRGNQILKGVSEEAVHQLVIEEVRADLKASGVIVKHESGVEYIAKHLDGAEGFSVFERSLPVGRVFWVSREEVEGLLK